MAYLIQLLRSWPHVLTLSSPTRLVYRPKRLRTLLERRPEAAIQRSLSSGNSFVCTSYLRFSSRNFPIMAVSVMARCGPGLGGAFGGQRRCHAQPCRPPVSFMRVARPMMFPARAAYRYGNCGYNNWDEETMKRAMYEMESMAKQWRETGKVSGTFKWPGGGVSYKADRSGVTLDPTTPNSSSANSTSSSSGPSLPLDVVSTDGFYLVYADVPGLSKADLSIKLSKERVLTLSGQRQRPVEEGFSQQERQYGAFSRSWALPDDADSEGVSAKVAEGVLTVTLPKKQPEPEVDDSHAIEIN